jgi:hypothetical protein
MGYEARIKFRKDVHHLIELFEKSRRNEVAKRLFGGSNVTCQSGLNYRKSRAAICTVIPDHELDRVLQTACEGSDAASKNDVCRRQPQLFFKPLRPRLCEHSILTRGYEIA